MADSALSSPFPYYYYYNRPPGPSLLEKNSKPLLSIDPSSVLTKSLEIVTTKLRTLSTTSSPPLLTGEEDGVLADIVKALTSNQPGPPTALALIYKILTSWPSKAEFATLSLLRPLMTQAWIYKENGGEGQERVTYRTIIELVVSKLPGLQSKAAQV